MALFREGGASGGDSSGGGSGRIAILFDRLLLWWQGARCVFW